MSPLTYLPAYLGLYFTLLLAVACNAFLDIQYGQFGTEVLIWAIVLFVTLFIGWRQQGNAAAWGRNWQKGMLAFGALVSLVIFVPVWGFPRAGVYMLAALQASSNCVTTTRRQLYFGILVAVVMAMFAASHPRADWTLLFYLLPFVVVVVFTLVAEQVSRRADDLRSHSLSQHAASGQGAAIVAAASVILLLATFLYVVTPQISWTRLSWSYGMPTSVGPGGDAPAGGVDGAQFGLSSTAGSGDGAGRGSGGGTGSGGGGGGGGLTPDEMRRSAQAPGMPSWQSGTINALADAIESIGNALSPIVKTFRDLWAQLKKWLNDHLQELIVRALLLLLLALLAGLWMLVRKARLGLWLRTRVDYVRHVVLGWTAGGEAGAVQLYGAMERLFAFRNQPREAAVNTREYLSQLCRARGDLRTQLIEITSIFEAARYGSNPPREEQLARMRDAYRLLFRRRDRLPPPQSLQA